MAKKDKKGRLTIPIDIWNISKLSNRICNDFGFFITKDYKVCIMEISHGKTLEYEFLSHCKIDEKRRFSTFENVEAILGEGDTYYFSVCFNSTLPLIYIYKTDAIKYHRAKSILVDIKKSFDGLDAYLLQDDIDD